MMKNLRDKNHQLTHFFQPFYSLLLIGLAALLLSSALSTNTKAEEVIPLYVGENIKGEIAIYNTIKIPIRNLDDWSRQATNNPNKFVLQIDGISFLGLSPTLVKDNTHLQFDLKRTPESKEAWKALLSRKPIQAEKKVFVTVRQNNAIVHGEAEAIMIVIEMFWFKVFITVSSFTLLLFLVLTINSDVLRVSGKQPRGLNRKPYSLARTQMAFWFFTIIISYVFIWMVTRDLGILTPSVLGLMGLSAATGLGSAIMDSSKRTEKEKLREEAEFQLQESEVEVAQLDIEINQMYESRKFLPDIAILNRTNTDPLTEKESYLAAKNMEIELSRRTIRNIDMAAEPRISVSFFADILSDDKGYSFHRVQMFAWTIVLIVIFITSVSSLLAMPDFDTTLLGLVGISGATYLGFKFPNQEG